MLVDIVIISKNIYDEIIEKELEQLEMKLKKYIQKNFTITDLL